jgi:transposase InsO family protein
MKLKYSAGSKLNELCSSVGIPAILVTDNADEETGGEWETVQRKHLIPQRYTEPRTPWKNKAELEIGEEKAHYHRIVHRAQALEALWDHGFEHTDQIFQNTARKNLG